MTLVKPMKAPSKSVHDLMRLEDLTFPRLVSFKVDGFRATVQDATLLTSSLKPVVNEFTQKLFGFGDLEGFDGELTVGEPVGRDLFSRTSSGVTSRSGQPDVRFYVFDIFDPRGLRIPYVERAGHLRNVFNKLPRMACFAPRVHLLKQVRVNDLKSLLLLEQEALALGYEGLMLRSLEGPYKEGPNRATLKEGYLLKLKRFEHSEARITKLAEGQTNLNEARTDELGRSRRSASKAGKVASGTLGKLIGIDVHTKEEVIIGPGTMKHDERAAIWQDHSLAVGKLARYKFFPTGTKDAPRFPTFEGWRDPSDMTEHT